MLSISLGIPFGRIGLQFAAEVCVSRVFIFEGHGAAMSVRVVCLPL